MLLKIILRIIAGKSLLQADGRSTGYEFNPQLMSCMLLQLIKAYQLTKLVYTWS